MTKLIELFPTKACGRCGGCGRYSYNTLHGDTCYGCGGSGLQWANRRVEQAVAAYRSAVKASRERLAGELVEGVVVAVENDRLASRKTASGEWVEVRSISETDRPSGWSQHGKSERVVHYFVAVELVDGRSIELDPRVYVRTCGEPVDVATFVAAATA